MSQRTLTTIVYRLLSVGVGTTFCLWLSGCALVPDVKHADRFHNPFPQLRDVAVLPFFNLSDEPTLDTRRVASAYYAELQSIPGFIVRPIGQTEMLWNGFLEQQDLGTGSVSGEVFQQFAEQIGVDAVVVGAVTDFDPYYPPRLGLTTHWYAANRGFHPIPPGYGLPWGTPQEKRIPRWIVNETEAALAREQLETQAPIAIDAPPVPPGVQPTAEIIQTSAVGEEAAAAPEPLPAPVLVEDEEASLEGTQSVVMTSMLPTEWPDARGLIPPQPDPQPPLLQPQNEPILTHTRLFQGADSDFTQALEHYFYKRDDARFGGWQGYLTRTDDFLRFCAHLHITQMLESRGGRDKSDLILRWPISRYER